MGETEVVSLTQNGSPEFEEGLLLSKEELLGVYRNFVLTRALDEKAIVLYKQNKAHFQIGCSGHEAIQIAAAMSMRSGEDWAYPYYRDLAFCLTLGMSSREVLLSVLNKADDPNSGGRQMPMHYGHRGLNIVNQSSPTGTQYIQSVGAALAIRARGGEQVVYVSSGEGTTAQGDYHEALNWAAREKLPVIFVIQNNKFAISVPIAEQLAGESVVGISSGYEGLEAVAVNGLDFFESYHAMGKAVARARAGQGPTVIEAEVVRLMSHSISDNQLKYRSEKELEKDKERDPLDLFEEHLLSKKIVEESELLEIRQEVRRQVDQDAEWAESQADPAPETWGDNLVLTQDPGAGIVESKANGPESFLVEALRHALDEELSRNPEMVIFGQDVAYGKGGVFSVTMGLTDKYGVERVFNSPLAESSILGAAIGLATLGMKPVVEVQFGDYVWTGMMQIRNELAMMLYRSNGAFSCPAVVRVAVGGYIHGAIYHSQNIEATFSHFPGLTVVMPSNATDGKGMLKAAIRGDDPVLFLEHKGLYRQVYAKGPEGGEDDLVPLGRAKVVREGKDATIVSWGALVHQSLVVAEQQAKQGIQIEVIDIRSMVPLDKETIINSVRKTNRLLIAHEDVLFMGFGAEIAATVAESCFEYLDAPIKRVGGRFTPVPHSPVLEEQVLPQASWITEGLSELLNY